MGRPRLNNKDNRLPPRVYKYKYSYVWKPKETGSSVTLAPVAGTSMSMLWAKYEAEIAKRSDVMTLSKLWNLFLESPVFTELAPRTQKDYRQHQRALLNVFGKMRADSIKIEQVRIFMDKRGLESKTQANHELASLSRVYGWGFERGYVKSNPCKGVRKFTTKARTVYITDEQYAAIYHEAIPALRIAMEISYLCAARLGDVLDLRWNEVMDAGLYIEQNKTGAKQIKEWSPRLRSAIQLARNTSTSGSDFVITTSKGSKVITKTLNNWWNDAKRAAEQKAGMPFGCNFHDIKAKGISDYEGSSRDKQLFSGHKTESQVLVYDRKVKITPSLDAPLLEKQA
ncbi:TPA: tyrosine-type recombinase/integrase [Klebsiella oxytoca]|uniref:tyrosine-type recombinase/integrase n=1 Tax=Klebsiella sp. HN106 TaxID=3401058 RepID=UPI00277B79DD|nr:tyrosine-type recombinase/integrase [Klebsiella oxytoca]HCQ6671478.1 tyrosine-type recombinase/integrase [Klebsiella oxytoca]HDS6412449.1 tyrosine-type recombinase/integrase [Klebsiella oxytoca]